MSRPVDSTDARDAAREQLQLAMRLHAEDRIDDALAAARRAIEIDPSFADAHSYLGSTLVTRKRSYRAGLASLERARDLQPDDVDIRYTLAWSYEYVAHEQSGAGRRAAGVPSPDELRERAIEEYRACLALDPEPGLRDDIEKLLERLEIELEGRA